LERTENFYNAGRGPTECLWIKVVLASTINTSPEGEGKKEKPMCPVPTKTVALEREPRGVICRTRGMGPGEGPGISVPDGGKKIPNGTKAGAAKRKNISLYSVG